MGLNGIPQKIFNEIAKDQKIVHPWLKELFELRSDIKTDKMVDEMMETFQKEVLEPIIPKLIQGNADPRRVTRAVFMVLPIYLERKAIAEWIQDSRRTFSPLMFPHGPRSVLPEINTPHEAAELAARELMLNSKEIELVKLIETAAEGVDCFPEEINNVLRKFYSEHNGVSTSLHGLNSTQLQILGDIAVTSGKLGRLLILKGYTNFNDWMAEMKAVLLDSFIENGLDEETATEIIGDAWTTSFYDESGKPCSQTGSERSLLRRRNRHHRQHRRERPDKRPRRRSHRMSPRARRAPSRSADPDSAGSPRSR